MQINKSFKQTNHQSSAVSRQLAVLPANLKFKNFNPKLAQRAFTLVEVVVVCAILAILAATIIPGILSTSKDAKVSAAKTDISELGSALERFYINMDRYPTSDEGLAVLTDPPSDAGTKR